MKSLPLITSVVFLYGCQTTGDTRVNQISLSCHEERVIGMDWIKDKWEGRNGKPNSFTLTFDLDKNHLSKESIARVFSNDISFAKNWSCETFTHTKEPMTDISICRQWTQVIGFNYKTLTGSESNSFGNLFPPHEDDNGKDTMYVSAFTCSKTI